MLSSKTTLWLFILLMLVSAAAWFEKKHLPTGGFRAMPSCIVSVDISRADRIEIETTNTVITCSRRQDLWQVDEPIRCRADSNRIDFVLDTIARTPARDRVSPRQRKNRNLSLNDYGLVLPRAVVSIGGRDGVSTLRLGADTPFGDSVFVMASDSYDVYIADRMLLDMLPKSLDDFRDHALIPVSQEIVGVEIRQPGKGIINVEKTASGWIMTSPFAISASMPAVHALLGSLANATIEKFVWTSSAGQSRDDLIENAGASLGLSVDESKLSATVKFAKGSVANFSFGSLDPDSPDSIYVVSSLDNSIFTVRRSIIDALQMDAEVLRERRVFPLLASEVISVSCNSANASFAMRLNNDLSAWTISRPSVQPTDQKAATAFIEELLRIEDVNVMPMSTEEERSLENNGMDTVKIEILPVPPLDIITAFASFKRDAEGNPLAFEIAIPDKKLRHLIPADRLPLGFLEPAWFASMRDKTILSIPEEMLSAITRRLASSEETAILGRDGQWFSAKPLPITANKDSLEALTTLVANFKAQRVATLFSANTEFYGLNPAAAEFTITTKLPETPVVILLVGNSLPDGSAYVKVKGHDAVFMASPEDVAVLARALTLKPAL